MVVDLYTYRNNVFSQNGEDGILNKLLQLMNIAEGYFVEFGAWNGIYWSNTYSLYKKNWSGCYIEANTSRFQALCKNVPEDRVLKLNKCVTETGTNALDSLLISNNVTAVDLLSIDIDSDDLRIWESVIAYFPTIVVIEYNSSIPFDTRFVNPPGKQYGSSALSIVEAATKKGYRLAEGTDTNLIFIKNNATQKLDIHWKSLQEIRDQTVQLRYFFGYDGTLLHDFQSLNEMGVTEYYPIPFSTTLGIQPIPKIIRKVRDGTNFTGLIYFSLVALIRTPIHFFRLVTGIFRYLSCQADGLSWFRLLFDKRKLIAHLKEDRQQD